MNDICNKDDLVILVNLFYQKVVKDEVIGSFFTHVANIDWDKHLPTMYQFWNSILFGEAEYKGNPMQKHFPINEMQAMQKHHFEQWICLWENTVNELYQGENASIIIAKANNIANLMAYKMEQARKN